MTASKLHFLVIIMAIYACFVITPFYFIDLSKYHKLFTIQCEFIEEVQLLLIIQLKDWKYQFTVSWFDFLFLGEACPLTPCNLQV